MGNCIGHNRIEVDSEVETKDLRFAVDKNDNKLMLRLLDGGADPNEGSAKVMFPLLHMAVKRGNSRGVELLLRYGADPFKKDCFGHTPVTIASAYTRDDRTLKVLQEHIQNLRTTNDVIKTDAMDTMRAIGREMLIKALANPHPDSIIAMVAKADAKRFGSSFSRPFNANRVKIFLSCPFRGYHRGTPIFLPETLEELINIGVKKYNFLAGKITTPKGVLIKDINVISAWDRVVLARNRIVVSCPKKQDQQGRLVWMPESLEDLINMGLEKYGFPANKVMTIDGVKIEHINQIKDGDHVILDRE